MSRLAIVMFMDDVLAERQSRLFDSMAVPAHHSSESLIVASISWYIRISYRKENPDTRVRTAHPEMVAGLLGRARLCCSISIP